MSRPTYQLAEDLIDNITASVSSTTASQTYTIANLGSGLTYSNATVTGSPYPNVTISAGTNTQPWFNTNAGSKIRLDGAEADIEVNGWSLVDAIQKIEERLNILRPNPGLETEWEELRALGEQYRKLEQHIKDKQATWDKLKAMTPPVID